MRLSRLLDLELFSKVVQLFAPFLRTSSFRTRARETREPWETGDFEEEYRKRAGSHVEKSKVFDVSVKSKRPSEASSEVSDRCE